MRRELLSPFDPLCNGACLPARLSAGRHVDVTHSHRLVTWRNFGGTGYKAEAAGACFSA